MGVERVRAVQRRLSEAAVDAVLISHPANRRWITHVSASDASPSAHAGWVFVTLDDAALVTSPLYYSEAIHEAVGVRVVLAANRVHETFADLVRQASSRRVGFERGWFTFQNHADLTGALAEWATPVEVSDLVEPLRAIKDEDEVASIVRAVALSDGALTAFFDEVRPEITEREAAWFLEAYMRTRGSEGVAFEVGVATGVHSAVPHHKPGDTPLGIGAPIWIDIGARVDGYCSDITRSFVLGYPSDEYRRLWQATMDAQKRALETIAPGKTGRDCDAAARDHLTEHGLGELFTHSLGHGVGLMIHEGPRLGRTSGDVLTRGMITSVEPGIYRPEWGGIRHEELVQVTNNGCAILTRTPNVVSI